MSKKKDEAILYFFLFSGIALFINLIRKPPIKDWLLIFFFKAYISSTVDTLLVKKDYLKYPIRIFDSFNISFIFDYLLFPISCVYYNQLTKHSNFIGVVLKVLYFSIPMAIIEHWLVIKTKLIEYKKGWTSFTSFFSLTITFLITRSFIALVRKISEGGENVYK